MKTSYHPRNRTRKHLLGRVSVLLLIFILGFVVLRLLDDTILSLARPVWKSENFVSRELSSIRAFFNTRRSLETENTMLKDRVFSLEKELSNLSGRLYQQDVMEDVVNRSLVSSGSLATVLTRPPSTPYDVLVVDLGGRDGVYVGANSYTPEGSSLGKVTEIMSNTSKVTLYSEDGIKTPAYLERGDVPITLVGTGGGNFSVKLPRDISVEVGDRIISPDIKASIIAVVGEIDVRPTDSFKTALARTPASIFNIRFVFIEK